jgi:hypothetical protein
MAEAEWRMWRGTVEVAAHIQSSGSTVAVRVDYARDGWQKEFLCGQEIDRRMKEENTMLANRRFKCGRGLPKRR